MTGHKSNSFLRPLISLKEFWVLFYFVFYFFPSKEGEEGKEKSSEAEGLTGEDRKRNSCPFSKRWRWGTGKRKAKM